MRYKPLNEFTMNENTVVGNVEEAVEEVVAEVAQEETRTEVPMAFIETPEAVESEEA